MLGEPPGQREQHLWRWHDLGPESALVGVSEDDEGGPRSVLAWRDSIELQSLQMEKGGRNHRSHWHLDCRKSLELHVGESHSG
jgi:hypothetical protein